MTLKTDLLETIAGKNRGLLTTEVDRANILTVIDRLEDQNPTSKPLETPQLLEGDWRLVYTTSKGILGINRFPLMQLGQVYQCIRPEQNKIYNIAELEGIPFLEGLILVEATLEKVSDKRVNVFFHRFLIGSQRLMGYRFPKGLVERLISGQKFMPIDFGINSKDNNGWLEITYLDEDLRIGRGNEGSVFVLSKEKY
ncbi:fibrillin family protein [[Leptolyngbya] sp. PCC 7376]|uniref:PAP/fibrillin family protein n=1 Tax=[Leptolyngbya] sp. PCC 7376 TaxID=111781 RepID=UPI00029EF0C0|nr:PAP/fibrillin family protein [[Leptolyngbya] sp. PCC 7376]AFY39277.1 fibrillin family protein [[Leptolyngbya] sp. PCC 7376]